ALRRLLLFRCVGAAREKAIEAQPGPDDHGMRSCAVLLACVAGCGLSPSGVALSAGTGDVPADDGTTTGPAAESSGDDGTSSSSGVDSGTTGDDLPLKLDVMPPDQPPPASGCTKVDFLFVIDSSASMRHHQDNLAASFGGFITAIEEALDTADDYQIMVVDTDPDHIAICEQYCGFGSPICSGYACGDAAVHWDECDTQYGSGVRHPLGWNASNTDCQFASDDRYLTSDQDDLAAAFACAAKVGTSTNVEWQLLAMAAALDESVNGDGGCNAGFVRDDALLVVTLITDEPDTDSGDTLEAWRDKVVEAKGGDADAVVMLGILPPDVEDPSSVCMLDDPDDPQAAPDLHEFVAMFPRTITGDVCAADYAPFLAEAVALIDVACEEYEPVG
ncbi:MAG: hypothetical protein AAF721_35875, partial [Myxococcota bacterium]